MTEVALELRRRGVRVVALVLDGNSETRLFARLRDSCSVVRSVPSLAALRRVLKETRSPVLVFGVRSSLKARVAGIGLGEGVPIFDARNGLEYGRPAGLWALDRWSQWRVRRYVVNSFAAREHLLQQGIQRRRVTVLESALGDQWLQRTLKAKDPKRVVMIGNSRPEKDHALGLQAVLMVKGSVHLSVYTDDASALRSHLASRELDPTKTIDLIEGQEVTPDVFAAESVLLHPSRSESLPRVVLEAMSQGVVPVATDTGDTARIIGADGWVVPVGDVQAMSLALEAAMTHVRNWTGAGRHIMPRGVSQYCDELIQVLT